MVYAHFEKPAQDAAGNLLLNIQCEVRREDVGSLPLEPLFSDRYGDVPLSNPFIALDGIPSFFCAGGAFRIRYFKEGFDETFRYVGVGLGAENDLQGFVPMGSWDDETTYVIGDVVTHEDGGPLYLFASKVDDNINEEPNATGPAESAFWAYIGLAIQGPQGDPGLIGNWRGAWATLEAYVLNDAVEYEGSSYICIESHTAGTFATDLAASKWDLAVAKGDHGDVETIVAGTAMAVNDTDPAHPVISLDADASDIPFTPSGSVTATNVQSAIAQLAGVSLPALFPGSLYGLTLSNNGTDATNDIDIAAGVANDGGDTDVIVLASVLTKRLDAAWSVGSNQGGRDTGSIADGTYHVWLIKRSDTGVVDVLFSTSATAPTMPANYDLKRRIGSIIRSGGTILAFAQNGDRFDLSVPVNNANTSNPGTSAVTVTTSVPDGIVVEALISFTVYVSNTSGNTDYYGLLTSLAQADTAPSSTLCSVSSNDDDDGSASTVMARIMTNTSGQVRYRMSASPSNISLTTHGWIDTRGRV